MAPDCAEPQRPAPYQPPSQPRRTGLKGRVMLLVRDSGVKPRCAIVAQCRCRATRTAPSRPTGSFPANRPTRGGTGRGILTASRNRRRSEEHTSELQSPCNLVCRLLLEKKKKNYNLAMMRSNMRICTILRVTNHVQYHPDMDERTL